MAPPDTAVVDLYLMVPPADHPTADELADAHGGELDAAELPLAIRRVAVIAVHPCRRRGALRCSRSAAPTRTAAPVLDAGGEAPASTALRRGPQVPRPPPDDLQAPAHVATVELRDRSPPVDRRRLRLRLRRQGQSGRPAPRRRRRDPRPDAGARRRPDGRGDPRGRALPWPAASTRSAAPGPPTHSWRGSTGTG